MIPRGEVSLIAATAGASLGAVASELFSVVVAMTVLTALVVPPLLMLLYRGGHLERSVPVRDWQGAQGVLPEF